MIALSAAHKKLPEKEVFLRQRVSGRICGASLHVTEK